LEGGKGKIATTKIHNDQKLQQNPRRKKGGIMGFKIENSILLRYEEEAGITEIVIPEGVTSIGDNAFSECRDLTSINIPESVTSIGDRAFSGCWDLTRIDIPESVTSIGDYAFFGCWALVNINIPEGIASIGDGVFFDCECYDFVKSFGWKERYPGI
jgi:hypothetical protein